jgi:hypothetical protein
VCTSPSRIALDRRDLLDYSPNHHRLRRRVIVRSGLAALVSVAALCAVVPRAVDAAFITYDLTGTWTGTITCAEFVDGAKEKTVSTPSMQVSQVGLNIGLTLDFGGGNVDQYAGLANPDAKKPDEKGEFAVVFCGTNSEIADAVPDKLGRMVASTKPNKVKATIKGTTIFSDPPGLVAHHGTCKWKFTRTDSTNSLLPTDCSTTITGLAANGGAR